MLRGQFVLGEILCSPPPPPPPGVEGLKPETMPSGTLRQRLEQHRADRVCAACHQVMDAIGFGLESFDAVGAWRTTDAGFPVDATGELPGGTRFTSVRELARLVAGDARFSRCVAYSRNISWSGPATPLPKLTNPQTVFDRLFEGLDPTASSADQTKRRL